jgi:hypothetical protein
LQVVGTKDKFALVMGPAAGQLRAIQVWAGGRNLTPVDTSAYLPSFVHAMERSEILLRNEERIFRYEASLRGLTVEDALEQLVSQALPQARAQLRVLDWGETMDDVLCFLVPVRGKVHLAWKEFPSGGLHSLQVVPSELAEVMRRGREILKTSDGTNA